MECVDVKIEPLDYAEKSRNGEQFEPPSKDESVPEFVNIKQELDENEQDDSLKAESSYNLPQKDGGSWHVPITGQASSDSQGPDNAILPDNMLKHEIVQIAVKIEPDDYCGTESDEDLSLQPATSLDDPAIDFTPEGTHRYSCRICFKGFANSGNVQRHMLTHAREKINCPQCTRQFLTQEKLDKHLPTHSRKPERSYSCDHCDKSFKSSSNLMQHKKVHLDVKPFECPLCHKTFAFKANLAKHQGKSRCKIPRLEPLQCNVCHKIFQKEFLLKSHLRRHDPERPYRCEHCKMNFKYKSTLIRHNQLHNGEKPFTCPVCDKPFTHSGLLKPHMRVHTGEKPYPCPHCEKSFAHKHNMQRHAMRHSKIKHLECDICHKIFPKESRLKYHMKTHTNEKHFACQVCPKRFSHKQNVLRHYTRKHPNSKYECQDTDASVALKLWETLKSKYSDDPGEILG